MDLQTVLRIDTVKYCNYVLSSYKEIFEIKTGVLDAKKNELDKLYIDFNNIDFTKSIIKTEADLTASEQHKKAELETEIARLEKATKAMYMTGLFNCEYTIQQVKQIERQLPELINKSDNVDIEIFAERLENISTPPADFIQHEITRFDVTEIEYLDLLQLGELPMFLNDFHTLIRFCVAIQKIQYIQYLHDLQAEIQANENIDVAQIIAASLKKPLTWNAKLSSIGTLFGMLYKAGIIEGKADHIVKALTAMFSNLSASTVKDNIHLAKNESEAKTKYDRETELLAEKWIEYLKETKPQNKNRTTKPKK